MTQSSGAAGSVTAAVKSVSMQVNPENVLQVRAAILGEAQRLKDSIKQEKDSLQVGRCGGDPVSGDAELAFTERIQTLAGQCDSYIAELTAAGYALGDTARSYGLTEEQIAASFR